MKKIIIVCFAVLLSACALKPAGKPSDAQLNTHIEIADTNDMNAFVSVDGKHRWTYPASLKLSDEEKEFHIEGNECIYNDYIIARVLIVEDEYYVITIGSNCMNDSEVLDGVMGFEKSEFGVYDLNVNDRIKIYYSFPDGFVPTDYLDYIDYGARIEKLS